MLSRYFAMPDALTDSVMLFGARQTGKTTLIRMLFPDAITYDLLKSDECERLRAYVGVYLEEEIKKEALVRNLGSFTRFLEVAAMTNGEMVNGTYCIHRLYGE